MSSAGGGGVLRAEDGAGLRSGRSGRGGCRVLDDLPLEFAHAFHLAHTHRLHPTTNQIMNELINWLHLLWWNCNFKRLTEETIIKRAFSNGSSSLSLIYAYFIGNDSNTGTVDLQYDCWPMRFDWKNKRRLTVVEWKWEKNKKGRKWALYISSKRSSHSQSVSHFVRDCWWLLVGGWVRSNKKRNFQRRWQINENENENKVHRHTTQADRHR